MRRAAPFGGAGARGRAALVRSELQAAPKGAFRAGEAGAVPGCHLRAGRDDGGGGKWGETAECRWGPHGVGGRSRFGLEPRKEGRPQPSAVTRGWG